MKTLVRAGLVLSLVGFGYGLSASGLLAPSVVKAQADATVEGPSEDTSTTIQAATDALTLAMQGLQAEGLYTPATTTLNTFAVTVGGVNAVEDLEAGRGVDPETFAALYAGFATDDVSQHLGKDAEGRLTYKGRPVRLYSISRLKRVFAERARLTGADPNATAEP